MSSDSSPSKRVTPPSPQGAPPPGVHVKPDPAKTDLNQDGKGRQFFNRKEVNMLSFHIDLQVPLIFYTIMRTPR